MADRDSKGPIERLRGLGEAIDRAISEARLRRVEIEEERRSDEVRELRRMLKAQARRAHSHK